MGNKSWQELATKAKDIARRIVNGDEENKNGERLIHIVYRLDTFATNALNKKFAQSGSIGSVHTYAGGTQVISTRHADGSEGSFNTDGECTPTDNPMDIEVDAYINGGNGGGGGQSSPAAAMVLPESKTNKNMKKNVVKINENTLRQIVAESVKKVLNESWSSNVLRQLCREHGNILVNNVPRGVLTSLQQMSDEEITNAYRMAHNGQNANAASIPFEDGFELQLAISNDNVKAQERTLKNWGYGQQQQIQNGNTGYNTHHKRNNPNTPY